jgi:uncharacterized protein YegL
MFDDMFDDVLKDILDIKDDERTDDITQYVAFVLDRSSSMQSIKQAAIDAFNEQLQTLKNESDDIRTLVTVTTFDTVPQLGEPVDLDAIQELNEKTYRPNGMTALYDAIGETALTVAKQYKKDKSDAAVLFVIVTDGYENASVKFNQQRIKSMVEELENTGRWTFTFLAANQNPLETAVMGMGMKVGNVMDFMATDVGMRGSSTVMSSSTSTYMASRKMGMKMSDTFYESKADEEETDEG